MLVLPTSLIEWARLLLVAILVGALCFSLGQCDGHRSADRKHVAALAEANREAMERDRAARDEAADRRLKDERVISEQEKGLRDAIADTDDEAPDAVRVRLGCERLRRAGGDPASLPAICRHGG